MRTRLMLIVFIALFMPMPAAAQFTPEDLCYQKGGNWNVDLQKCVLESGVQVTVVYPLELAPFTIAEKMVSQWLLERQQAFISSYVYVPEMPSYTNAWDLSFNYEWFSHASDTISLLFTISYYTGGAHPNMEYHSFTFNQADQRQLTLADVFRDGQIPWTDISIMVQENLRTKLGGEAADTVSIEQGTGTNPENYTNWVITEDSLIFYFPPYQVAAYAAGPQQVEIPFVALHALLAPPFEGA